MSNKTSDINFIIEEIDVFIFPSNSFNEEKQILDDSNEFSFNIKSKLLTFILMRSKSSFSNFVSNILLKYLILQNWFICVAPP